VSFEFLSFLVYEFANTNKLKMSFLVLEFLSLRTSTNWQTKKLKNLYNCLVT